MKNKDAIQRNQSGQKANELIEHMLSDVVRINGVNIEFNKGYAVGYPGKQKQFKMDYELVFPDLGSKRWLVKSTNSVRERVYGVEFFAQNILKIDDLVEKIFVVVPDSISEKEMLNKTRESKKRHNPTYVSFLTDILTVNELRKLILEETLANIPQGSRSNITGKDGEENLIELLNDRSNLLLWNNFTEHNVLYKTSTFPIFKEILIKSGFIFGETLLTNVHAEKEKSRLLNNGQPKTDIFLKILGEGCVSEHSISVKNTNSKSVTVHEGKVIDLISALDINKTSNLAEALLMFEKLGSEKVLKERNIEMYKTLHYELKEFNKKLVEFFIFGLNSPLIANQRQISDIIIYTNKFDVFLRDEYVDYYINNFKSKGQFGTPFKWTYPSKGKGKKVQIKAFTNN